MTLARQRLIDEYKRLWERALQNGDVGHVYTGQPLEAYEAALKYIHKPSDAVFVKVALSTVTKPHFVDVSLYRRGGRSFIPIGKRNILYACGRLTNGTVAGVSLCEYRYLHDVDNYKARIERIKALGLIDRIVDTIGVDTVELILNVDFDTEAAFGILYWLNGL